MYRCTLAFIMDFPTCLYLCVLCASFTIAGRKLKHFLLKYGTDFLAISVLVRDISRNASFRSEYVMLVLYPGYGAFPGCTFDCEFEANTVVLAKQIQAILIEY